jgi:HSP20 family protein
MAQEEHTAKPVEVKHPVSVPRAQRVRQPHHEHLRQLFHHDMDRMFERIWGGWLAPFHRIFEHEPAWRGEGSFLFADPALDLTEDDKSYTITAEVPGLEQKNIEVSLSGDILTLKCEKRDEREEKKKN